MTDNGAWSNIALVVLGGAALWTMLVCILAWRQTMTQTPKPEDTKVEDPKTPAPKPSLGALAKAIGAKPKTDITKVTISGTREPGKKYHGDAHPTNKEYVWDSNTARWFKGNAATLPPEKKPKQ